MLAKCSRCNQTFQTDRFGEQFCPFCGAQVNVAGPGSGAPMPGGAPGAQDQPAPIDDPFANGGWLNAMVATWKRSVFDPAQFFGRLMPGPTTGGAIGYAVVVLAVGGLFAGVYSMLQGYVQRGQLAEMQHQLGDLPQAWQQFMGMLAHVLQPSPVTVVVTPIAAVISFFISTALLHLALMIVGGNRNGFTATLRAVGFAQGPYIFNIIPFCGGFAGGIWTLVLSVMGLAGLHRIGIGRAIAAYVVLLVGVCCICAVPIAALGGVAASHMAGHGVYNVP